MDILMTSDIAAAMVGAGWSTAYNTSTPGYAAMKALAISMVARILSTSESLKSFTGTLNTDQKNQLLVAILNAGSAYMKRENLWKTTLSGVSIDLVSQEVLKLMNFEDKALFTSKTTPP